MTRAHDYRGAFSADGTRIRTRKQIPEVPAEHGLVVEDPASGFCGAVHRLHDHALDAQVVAPHALHELRVVQANTSGSEPLVRASAPMGDGTTALVAEFDPRALNDVIRAAGGDSRVVDQQRATVLDSGGYTAFEPLDDPALGALAASVSANAPRAEQPMDGRGAAARLVSAPGAPTDLGWVLIEEQDVTVAALADDGSRRATLVVIAVITSLAVGALAWTTVTVVLPARRLARHVERLAAGDDVPPLAPLRLDELGTAVAATNQFVAHTGPAEEAGL